MEPLERPEAFTGFVIPKRAGSSEGKLLTVQRGTAEFFGLWTLPRPVGSPAPYPDGGRAYGPRRQTQGAGKGYRIAYPDPVHARRVLRARFRLEEGHTKQTLQVLVDHLDAVNAPWLWLCNEHGSRLSLSHFHSRRVALAA
jgi:hypothetical protein